MLFPSIVFSQPQLSLQPLSYLTQLSLQPLSYLTQLSLQPLSYLTQLSYQPLSLANFSLKSLAPLLEMKSIAHLRF